MPSIITVGRRKTAVARVKLTDGSGKVTVNKKELEIYFPIAVLREEVLKPFEATATQGRYDAKVKVAGGGPTGQAGAIRLGIARSLVSLDEDHRQNLRSPPREHRRTLPPTSTLWSSCSRAGYTRA